MALGVFFGIEEEKFNAGHTILTFYTETSFLLRVVLSFFIFF